MGLEAGAAGGPGGGNPPGSGGAPPGGDPGGTPAGGQPGVGDSSTLKGLMSNPAYLDSSHKEHAAVVERYNAMAKKTWGEEPLREGGPPAGESDAHFFPDVPRPNLPPEVEAMWSTEAEAFLRQTGHEARLSSDQIKLLLSGYAKETAAQHEKNQDSIRAGFQALRTKWGEKLAQRLAFADDAVRQFSPRLEELIDRMGLWSSPDFAEVFAALGESMKERGLMVSDVDGIQGDQAIRSELRRFMKSDPYFDSRHKNHAAVVAAVNKLQMKLHGE